MILLIDNYDSFSYNLYQMIGVIDSDITVVRNDEISLDDIYVSMPDFIVISPGPGKPENAGISIDVVRRFYDEIPILGVCLGHQAIYKAFNGEISYAKELVHGKSSLVKLDTKNPLFNNLDESISAGRYHSLSTVKETLPTDIEVIAESDDGEIMAIAHKKYPVYGLQFHPESILTPNGPDIVKNFLKS